LFGTWKKIVRKFRSFEEADNADYDYYRALSGNEKLQLLLDLIMPENADAAAIERSARVHPLTEHERC
jgi:flagellum-specific peptidoglycan hydrolase FlgJ